MGFEVYPQHRDSTAGEKVDGEARDRVPTGQYGWRYRDDGNGAITAAGGEGFTTEDHAERAVREFSGDVVKGHAGLEVKRVDA